MADLSLVYYNQESLYKKCEEVKVFDAELQELSQDMLKSLSRFNGVGLAAPQIGKNIRLFVVDTRQKGERLVFVNPQIISTSPDSVPYDEGCLSFPSLYRTINRPSEVTINAQDATGKHFTLNASGLLARVIQHENDHLDGKVFIDHLPQNQKQKALNELDKFFAKILKKLNKEKN